jgi:hypothetical protein
MFSKAATAILGAKVAMASNSTAGTIHLSQLNIEKGSVTVSGLSSGAYMAVQMHVAYSSLFEGVGVFAGGPYYCGQGSLTIAEEQCMYGLMGGPQINTLISYTKNEATLGNIDATENMADDKVFVFSGSKDTTVYPSVVKTLEDYYGAFVTSKLTTEYNIPAQHCMPTTNTNYGEDCGTKKSPYIGKCAYDGAQQALQLFYGSLTAGTTVDNNLHKFDQTEFFTGSSTSINDFGYIYIPTACKDGSKCRLHMSFHGCLQDYADIGSDWAVHTGYNSWAEANNIIVVYPYVKADAKLGNGNACWDWWGYTGTNYVLKSGVQMAFAKDVLNRLMGV